MSTNSACAADERLIMCIYEPEELNDALAGCRALWTVGVHRSGWCVSVCV